MTFIYAFSLSHSLCLIIGVRSEMYFNPKNCFRQQLLRQATCRIIPIPLCVRRQSKLTGDELNHICKRRQSAFDSAEPGERHKSSRAALSFPSLHSCSAKCHFVMSFIYSLSTKENLKSLSRDAQALPSHAAALFHSGHKSCLILTHWRFIVIHNN